MGDTNYDIRVGIYQILNIGGAAIDPVTGELIDPDVEDYAEAALNCNNNYAEFSTNQNILMN